MKAIFAMLFFFSVIAISLCAKEEIISCEKTRVVPNQMHFTESSLFLQIDDMWVQPAALYVDADGFYFNAIRSEYAPGIWQCQKADCLFWNKGWQDRCQQCGTPRGMK